MNFCYLHPTVEAEGRWAQCGQFICINDYNILEEKFGKNNKKKGETDPVVLCPNCFHQDTGKKPKVEIEDPEYLDLPIHATKVMMCFQCGAKLNEKDEFCPSCGQSTSDEKYDATHPLGGVQSSKEI